MAAGTHHPRLRRPAALPGGPDPVVRIDVIENPLFTEDPRLAAQVEDELRHALEEEDLGAVQVRFRVCRDDAENFRFICKVENPPRDGDDGPPQWRWWSPLLETAQDFRDALEEGLKIRRHRLALWGMLAR